MMHALFGLILACAGAPTYIVEGVVVEVEPRAVVLDHDRIEGFMGPMRMPFAVDDPALLARLEPGDRVIGRLRVEGTATTLEKVRIVGKGPVPEPLEDGPAPLKIGEVLPSLEVPVGRGASEVLGPGRLGPVVLTFLYTRCPDATYCPATVARLQALQDRVPAGTTLLAITLDPEHDTPERLSEYAAKVGARSTVWRFGRLPGPELRELAMRAGLSVARSDRGEIVHGLAWLVLDPSGTLKGRFDGNEWPIEQIDGPLGVVQR